MDAKTILFIICILVAVYGVYIIVSRYKKYKQSTTRREKNAKLLSVILGAVLVILVVATLLNNLI